MKVSFVPSIGIKPVCALKNKGVHCSERLDSFEKENKEKAILLVIGTSMQTAFANILVLIARANGMKDLYIDKMLM